MTEPNLMQRIGVTPGKLALIGVLTVVLVTVIVAQLPGGADSAELALQRPTQSNPQQGIQEETKLGDSESSTTETEHQQSPSPTWPEVSIDRAIAFDPFAVPDWLMAARKAAQGGDGEGPASAEAQRRARKEEVLELLRKKGTTIVVISSGEKRAVIGEQSVRIGDTLEGFRITDITKQGVVLTEIEEE